MQINTQELIKEIAEEFDLPQSEVEKIIRSPFEFLRQVITNEPTKTVRMKRLGMFVNKNVYYENKNRLQKEKKELTKSSK